MDRGMDEDGIGPFRAAFGLDIVGEALIREEDDLARITSHYGEVYFQAIDSRVCRSSPENFISNGLCLGIRDEIPQMQAYRITSPLWSLKYVAVFPNRCT